MADERMRAGDLKCVAVIGAGTVARAFAHDLGAKGVEVRVWARRREQALELAEYSGVSVCEELRTAVKDADVVLICVSDRAIAEVAQLLAEASTTAPTMHTSGFHNEAPLAVLAERGVEVGSIHPLRAMPPDKTRRLLEGVHHVLKHTTFGVSGSDRAYEWAREIAWKVEGKFLRLPLGETAKHRYHAAASLLSNGMVALQAMVCDLLELDPSKGMLEDPALMAFDKLAQTTSRTLREGPCKALTGPAVRGDAETVRGHLKVLEGDARDAYIALTRKMIAIGLASERLSPEDAARVQSALDE